MCCWSLVLYDGEVNSDKYIYYVCNKILKIDFETNCNG